MKNILNKLHAYTYFLYNNKSAVLLPKTNNENDFSGYEDSERLSRGYFEEKAQEVARRIAALVKKAVFAWRGY